MDPQRRESEEVGRDMSFVFLFLLTAALSARDNQAKQQTALNLIWYIKNEPLPESLALSQNDFNTLLGLL